MALTVLCVPQWRNNIRDRSSRLVEQAQCQKFISSFQRGGARCSRLKRPHRDQIQCKFRSRCNHSFTNSTFSGLDWSPSRVTQRAWTKLSTKNLVEMSVIARYLCTEKSQISGPLCEAHQQVREARERQQVTSPSSVYPRGRFGRGIPLLSEWCEYLNSTALVPPSGRTF